MSEQRCDARWLDAIDFAEHRESMLFGHGSSPIDCLIRMLLDDPCAKLTPDLRFADALEDLDARITEYANTFAIDAWVWIAHRNNHPGNTSCNDRPRARGCAAMKRARFKCRIERRVAHGKAAFGCVSRSRDLSVILPGAKRVPPAQELAARADNRAADPRVVARAATRPLSLFNRETHPSLVLVAHGTHIDLGRATGPPAGGTSWMIPRKVLGRRWESE